MLLENNLIVSGGWGEDALLIFMVKRKYCYMYYTSYVDSYISIAISIIYELKYVVIKNADKI